MNGLIQVETEGSTTTFTLPCRVLFETTRWQRAQRLEPLAKSLLLPGIPATILFVILPLEWKLWCVLIACFFSVNVYIFTWREQKRLVSHQSRSRVKIDDDAMGLMEDGALWFDRYWHNPLDICRLRVLNLPLSFYPSTSEESPKAPSIWVRLNQIETSQYALVAEGQDGKPMYPIAVAYPQDTMLELGKLLQVRLGKIRERFHEELLQDHPGIQVSDHANYVPLCLGRRKPALLHEAPRPANSRVRFQRNPNGAIRFLVPDSGSLEEVSITASDKKLLIDRQRLLGKISHRIASGQLLKLEVMDPLEELEDETAASLAIEYLTATGKHEQIELLSDLSFEEIAWIALELKKHGPQPTPHEETRSPKVQFTIAHLGFLTLLAACVVAGPTVDLGWGWLYSATLLSFVMCVSSLMDSTWFLPWQGKSWTRNQVLFVSVALGLLWILRGLVWFLA